MIADYQDGRKATKPLYRKYRHSRAQELRLISQVLHEVRTTLSDNGQYNACGIVFDMQTSVDKAANRIFR